MHKFSEERIREIAENISGKQILVLGDLMVDRYLWGKVTRISPEAPVPIINIAEEEVRFGGAANVANNLINLGARPVLVGVVGNDPWGETFRRLLMEKDLPSLGLITDDSRPTTVKTRIIGNNQHVARVDREQVRAIPDEVQQQLLEYVEKILPDIDALILQDYNKGVLTPQLVRKVIELANGHKKIITVDPKFDNFLTFENVTLFKPNKKETEEALAVRINSRDDLRRAGKKLFERMHPRSVLITLGEDGVALFENENDVVFMGTRARKVSDVSGAGDTVIATVTAALAGGAALKEAVTLANFAAGIVCEEVGVVPIRKEKLIRSVLAHQFGEEQGAPN